MHLAKVLLESVTPYSASRNYHNDVPKLSEESAEAYDVRTWRHHAHVNEDGVIIIPGVCFAHAVKDAAQKRGDRIPGKGTKTYTATFDTLEVRGDINTLVRLDEVRGVTISCDPQGRRNGPKRVPRRFPMVDSWSGVLEFLIWDDVLTETVFAKTIADAGLLIGVGRYRPKNRGFNGRFIMRECEWRAHVNPMEVFAQAAE